MNDWIFYGGLAALMIHELDAIQRSEWRFFLGWTRLDDERAYQIFMAAHFPLLVIILDLLPDRRFQIALDVFLIGHALAHYSLRNHRLIQFNNTFSRLWIYGGALTGCAHLYLLVVLSA
jgi:hypothetical protein